MKFDAMYFDGTLISKIFDGIFQNFTNYNMIWKWSNMAHDKIYFPENNSILLVKLNKGSGEYSKIISVKE